MNQLPGPSDRLDRLRPFAKIRLVALDIDGTLAEASRVEVAGHVRDLCGSLKSFGVHVTVATGRAFAGAQAIIDFMSNEGSPIVLYNGAIVADRKGRKIYYRKTVPAPTVRAMLDIAARAGVPVLTYNCGPSQQSLIDMNTGAGTLENVTGWAQAPLGSNDYNGLPILWRPYEDLPTAGEATAVLFPSGCTDALLTRLSCLADISMTSSGAGYIEVRPAGVSKAKGLIELIEILNLQKIEVLAVGDNDNDREMLEWAGIGVAVYNASPLARTAADYVTTRRTAGGAIEVLRLVRSARRLFRDERNSRLWVHHDK